MSEHLVRADLAGHPSHGLLNLPAYLRWIRDGDTVADPEIRVEREGPIVRVDGGRGLGQVVAREGMRAGIEAAREGGVGVVALRNCGHVGRLADYAAMAAEQGCVALLFANVARG